MGVSFNVARTVNQAYAVGREGNVLDRLSERLRASFGGATIPPDIDYQPEMARAEVQEIATQVNHQPTEADVKIYGSEVEVSKSRDGYELNPAATMTSIDSAIDDMSGKVSLQGEVLDPDVTTAEAETAANKARGALSEPIEIKAQDGESWTIEPDKLGPALEVTKQDGTIDVSLDRDRLDGALTTVYDDLTVKTVNASYGFDSDGDVIVKPSPRRTQGRERPTPRRHRGRHLRRQARVPGLDDRRQARVHHGGAPVQEADRAARLLPHQLHAPPPTRPRRA